MIRANLLYRNLTVAEALLKIIILQGYTTIMINQQKGEMVKHMLENYKGQQNQRITVPKFKTSCLNSSCSA